MRLFKSQDPVHKETAFRSAAQGGFQQHINAGELRQQGVAVVLCLVRHDHYAHLRVFTKRQNLPVECDRLLPQRLQSWRHSVSTQSSAW